MAGEIQLKSLTLPMADGSNQKYVIPQAPDVSRDIADIQSAINDIEDAIAYCFSSLATYSVGDYVLYNGDLYRFTMDHAPGDFLFNDVMKVALSEDVKKINRIVAEPFDFTKDYSIGDYVLYGGGLHKFTNNHPVGPWNNTQAREVKISEEFHFLRGLIAEPVESSKTYSVGDYVASSDGLYRFTKNDKGNAIGQSSVKVYLADELKTLRDLVAKPFDQTKVYYVGDYVLYNGDLYKFTSNHSISSWNETHVTKVKITDEFDKIKVVVLKATYDSVTSAGVTTYTYMLPVTPSIITKYIADGNIVVIYCKVPSKNKNYIFVVDNAYDNELRSYNIKTNSIVIWNFSSAANRYEFQCSGSQNDSLVEYPSILRLAPSYNSNNKRVLNYKQSVLYYSFNYTLIFFIKSNGTGYDTDIYVATSCTSTSITFKNLFGNDTLVFQAQDQNSYAVEQ